MEDYFKEKRVRTSAAASACTAVLAYGYGMTNNIANYDTVYNQPGIGSGSEVSGRWVLGILTRITQRLHIGYSLPYFNILVSLVILAYVSVLLCRILRLSDIRSWVLLNIVTTAYPAVASMTFFSYTMVYYAVSLLLIAAGTLLADRRNKAVWFLVYSVLLALAAGIYQAFYPFAVMLAVLAVIRECLDASSGPSAVMRKGTSYIAAILLSYLWYRLGLWAVLALTGRKLTSYQGIDRMGTIEAARLPGMLRDIYRHFFLLPGHDYLAVSQEPAVRLCILWLFLLAAFLLLFCWKEKNRLKWLEMAGMLFIALPAASNMIILMTPDSTVYTMMAMGLLSIYYLPILLWDALAGDGKEKRRRTGTILTALLLVSSLVYVYQTNGCYRALEWHNIQTENYYTTLFTRIRSMEGFDGSYPVLFAGKVITDAGYYDPWSDTVFAYGGMRQFDSQDPENNGFNEFSRERFILNYLGYTARQTDEAEDIYYAEVLKGMNTYPNDGSIRITDGVILVKFEDRQ